MAPCTILMCYKKSQTSNFLKDGMTFHRYPHDPDLKKKWIIATKRENWIPSTCSVICSRHFTEDCFIPMKNCRRLQSSAVPTKYLPRLSIKGHSDIPMPSTSKPTGSPSMSPKLKSVMSPVTTAGNSNVVQDSVLKSPPSSSTRFPGSSSHYWKPVIKQLWTRIVGLTRKVQQKNKKIKKLTEQARYMRRRLVFLETIQQSRVSSQL